MDFSDDDDVLLRAPAASSRLARKFAPKLRSKQSIPNKKSASAEPTVGTVKEPSNNGECSFLDSNKSLQVINNSMQASPNVRFINASSDSSTAISENNIHSIFDSGKIQEVFSAEFELDPCSSGHLDFGSANAHKVPKIEPRPRVGNASTISSTSSSIMMEKSFEFPTCTKEVQYLQSNDDDIGGLNNSTCLPTSGNLNSTDFSDKVDYMSSSTLFYEDNGSLAGLIPSQSDSMNAMPSEAVVCSETTTFGKSTAETSDVISELELVDDCLTPYSTEELTKSGDSPTLADFLQQDFTGEKEDANERKQSLRKGKRSSIVGVEDGGGKSSRKLRKQAACESVNNSNSLIEDVDDYELDPSYIYNEQLEESNDEEVDNSSKKKRALTSLKKKSVAKNGKKFEKCKKANGDLEKAAKKPPKKFSHSSQRRKKCVVDKALLDDFECNPRSISIRNMIAAANHIEKLKKKKSKSTTNQSAGDFFQEAGAYYEEETFDSYDGIRDQDDDDDQASEKYISTTPLYNSHSFMDKPPRVKWSKQDTEKFYEALRQFGTDFTMIQKYVFTSNTIRQITRKFKNEDRHHPLQITDAMKKRSTGHHLLKLAVEKARQTSVTNANEDIIKDPSPGINDDVARTKQDSAEVQDQEDPVACHSPEKSDDSDDFTIWSQYQSDI